MGEYRIGREARRLIAIAMGVLGAALLLPAVAPTLAGAATTTFSNTSAIALDDPNSQGRTTEGEVNATASPYPSPITVSGMSGTVSEVTMSLNNVTYAFSDDIDVLLVSPGGQTLIPIAAVGPNTGTTGVSGSTLTLSDSGTQPSDVTPWGSNPDFKPSNFGSYGLGESANGFNEDFADTGTGGPAPPWGDPGQHGNAATFASQFDGIDPNGTWRLYVITTSGGDGTGAIAGGWTLNITTASLAATTTSLSTSENPSFTSAPNNSVTLTANVAGEGPVGEGTVEFTDGGTPISGCAAVAVSSGVARCTTSFTTEGDHALRASYSGGTTVGPSSATLTQEVNDHTTVTSGTYCDPGTITLNNPINGAADATPYPSHVFIEGLTGRKLADLSVTLNGVTYPESQDIDGLLVGPGGQSLILAADAGPNSGGAISDVTLTLEDTAASRIAEGSIWGAPASSVFSKPFNYGGLNESWGPPAPAGPYGNPGPVEGGTATLASVFAGTEADGTWSLYVITTSAGDGTGSISGGWCVTPTLQKPAATIVSEATPPSVSVGGSFTDTATVSPPEPTEIAPSGSVNFAVYGPNDAACSGAPVETATANLLSELATGPVGASESFTPSAPGVYRVIATYGGDGTYDGGATSCGDTSETVTVTKAAPSLTSTASEEETAGGEIIDAATLSGGHSPSGSITFKAYGPSDPTCSAAPAYTSAPITVSGDGRYVAEFTPSSPGSYRWVAIYSGDEDNEALAATCGEAQETSVVNPAVPELSTSASASVALGGELHDTATLFFGDSPSGTITFRLYGPSDPTCSAAPVYTSPAVVVSGAGSYESASFRPVAAGTYRWIASYGGDTNNVPLAGTCGEAAETANVGKTSPSLTTTASPGVELGGEIHDTATLTGGSSPGGTITFKLYGPSDPTCSATPVYTSPAVTVAGDGTYESGAFKPAAAGTYAWVAGYGGDEDNEAAAGACADTGETVLVGKRDQTISFGALPERNLGEPDFTLAATASSGLTVAYASETSSVCTVSEATVHLLKTGTCTISATQPGNADYNAAPAVSQSFTVSPAPGKPAQEHEQPPPEGGTPPRQGAIPPGQGATPPGQGATPPGQGATPPGQGVTPPEIGRAPVCRKPRIHMRTYRPKLRGSLTGKIGMRGVRVRLSLDRSAALEIEPELLYRVGGKSQTVALASRSFDAGRSHDLVFPLPVKIRGVLPLGTTVEISMKLTATVKGDKNCTEPQHVHSSLHVRVAQLERPRH